MSNHDTSKEDEAVLPLPGFRFHPTDEELVGFYLRRKVEKKPVRIELIKQIDIYKYDPWDLPSKDFFLSDQLICSVLISSVIKYVCCLSFGERNSIFIHQSG